MLQVVGRDPAQTTTAVQPFAERRGEFSYRIEPVADYELSGLVVAEYDSENWLDVMHKKDPFNSRDLCVLWGDNTKNDLYGKIKFTHGEFTCFFQTNDRDTYKSFRLDQISNNHFLPKDDEVYRVVKEAKIGDQIYFKGQLANYKVSDSSGQVGSRQTSTVRRDTGNGACEVVYLTDFKILKRGQPFWLLIERISGYSALASLFFIILIFFLQAGGPRGLAISSDKN
jgi:hypothetical protein